MLAELCGMLLQSNVRIRLSPRPPPAPVTKYSPWDLAEEKVYGTDTDSANHMGNSTCFAPYSAVCNILTLSNHEEYLSCHWANTKRKERRKEGRKERMKEGRISFHRLGRIRGKDLGRSVTQAFFYCKTWCGSPLVKDEPWEISSPKTCPQGPFDLMGITYLLYMGKRYSLNSIPEVNEKWSVGKKTLTWFGNY